MTEINVSIQGQECHIRIARPEANNTLTLDGIRQLAAAIREAGRDGALKLIRIRSSGESFCGGRAPGKPPERPPTTAQFRRAVADPILDVYRALHESEIPAIAEVQGNANGFGCALVAACDLAIASDNATFCLPEMRNNLPPTLVLSVLRYKVPPKAAAHLVYLTSAIDARMAREFGIIAEVVPQADLTARGDEIAASITSRDRIAIAALKTYFREIVIPDFSLASEVAGAVLSGAMTSMRGG
jgi:enoyl-CoA hydratase/carnithine racemase